MAHPADCLCLPVLALHFPQPVFSILQLGDIDAESQQAVPVIKLHSYTSKIERDLSALLCHKIGLHIAGPLGKYLGYPLHQKCFVISFKKIERAHPAYFIICIPRKSFK